MFTRATASPGLRASIAPPPPPLSQDFELFLGFSGLVALGVLKGGFRFVDAAFCAEA